MDLSPFFKLNSVEMKIVNFLNGIKKDLKEPKPKPSIILISNIYYDTDWWRKPFALEWWQKDGHFNEELYREILSAKLDEINNLKE